MLRSLPAAALVFGVGLLAQIHAVPCAALVVRDDLKRDVAFAHTPQRIITLLPSLTETVCGLDACDRLIATDRYSNWPARVLTLPKAGGLDDATMELIVGMKPDLVLLSRSQRVTDRLQELGIPTFALDTQTYADVGRNIRTIGQILDVSDRAATLAHSIDAAVQEIGAQSVVQLQGRHPSVYFEVDRAPYAAGPASFIGELLTRLGTRNIVTPDLGSYPKLNPEYVVRHAPDVIFVSEGEASRLAQRPGWDRLRAVKEQRICSFPPDVGDTIVRPGPRVPEGMRALSACLGRMAPP